MSALTFGSLFAGIGGFDLGFERAGMVCAWQVEINDYCRRVLAKHWPHVQRYIDVRECGKANLGAVDVICGGFPCQPHSLAGKRLGAADDRNLWPEYFRIVAEVRPRWVVAENVPGIRTTILDQVLSDLEGLDYSARTLIIPACATDAPHQRNRVFVVAYTDSGGQDRAGVSEEPGEFLPVSLRSGAAVSDAEESGLPDREYGGFETGTEVEPAGLAQPGSERRSGAGWAVEPDVARVVYGLPGRVDRVIALGNAVVPQVAEYIGRHLVAVDRMVQHG